MCQDQLCILLRGASQTSPEAYIIKAFYHSIFVGQSWFFGNEFWHQIRTHWSENGAKKSLELQRAMESRKAIVRDARGRRQDIGKQRRISMIKYTRDGSTWRLMKERWIDYLSECTCTSTC